MGKTSHLRLPFLNSLFLQQGNNKCKRLISQSNKGIIAVTIKQYFEKIQKKFTGKLKCRIKI
jgi:hypothetical protein